MTIGSYVNYMTVSACFFNTEPYCESQNSKERRIWNPGRQLEWIFFAEIVNGWNLLTISA